MIDDNLTHLAIVSIFVKEISDLTNHKMKINMGPCGPELITDSVCLLIRKD